MADDPSDLEARQQVERRLMAAFVELLQADGVLVIYTWSNMNETKGRMTSWGNQFAVRGLLDWAYDQAFGEEPEPEDEDDEDEEDD